MILVLYALVWCFAAAFPLTDSDIWWHLASAREMLKIHSFLYSDPFTFTANGHAWSNVHWLYQLLLYFFYQVAGEWGILSLHVVAWGAVAWTWSKGKSSANLLFLGIICAIGIRYLLLARPIVFTLLLLGIQIRIWETSWKLNTKVGSLIGVQILLANMQGLFLLGPFLLVAWMWKDGIKGSLLWRIPSVLVLVSAIHPNGFRHLIYPLELLIRQLPGNTFAMGISENISPLRSTLETPNSFTVSQMLVLLIITLLWVLKAKQNFRFLVFLPLIVLGWLAERNLPILALVILPQCVPAEFFQKKAKIISGLGLSILLGFVVAQGQWWFQYPSPVSPYRFPQTAAVWLQSQLPENGGLPAKIFCETRHGGYLVWKLYPGVQTYADGRLILRDSQFLKEYLALEKQPQGFEQLDSLWNMDWAVLPTVYPPLFQNLAQYLRGHPNWTLVFLDRDAWVFRKGNWPDQFDEEFVDSLLSITSKEPL